MQEQLVAARYPKPYCPECRHTIPSHQAFVLRNRLQQRNEPERNADIHYALWCECCMHFLSLNIEWYGQALKVTSTFKTAPESVFLRTGRWGHFRFHLYLLLSRTRHGKKAIRPASME